MFSADAETKEKRVSSSKIIIMIEFPQISGPAEVVVALFLKGKAVSASGQNTGQTKGAGRRRRGSVARDKAAGGQSWRKDKKQSEYHLSPEDLIGL